MKKSKATTSACFRPDVLPGASLALQVAGLAVFLLLGLAPAANAQTPTPNLAAETDQWKGHSDGGNPPRILPERSIIASGQPALRLSYLDLPPHWGNIVRDVDVPASARAIYLRFYKHSSSPQAALHLWLMEPDGDRWVQQVVVNGKPFGDLADGWYEVNAAIGAFRFEPRGDGKKSMSGANRLLVGCNYGDMQVSFAEIRFFLAGETPGEVPSTLPPPVPESGVRGRVAILAENFIMRKQEEDIFRIEEHPGFVVEREESPSAADPQYLAEVARRAGYGVTLLSASNLSSPGYLSPNNFDILVIPSAPYYPLNAGPAISAFLASGGSLFSTGGYAFDKPSIRAADAWETVDRSLTVSEMDAGKAPRNLNHRFGIPADGAGPGQGEVPLFDPAAPLQNAAYAESLVDFIPRVRMEGPFEGWAATALLGNNDPVFPRPHARRIPLLMGYDSTGRQVGALGAIVHNHAGPFRRSSWAAFGVTNADLFSRHGTLAINFPDILDRIRKKVYLHSLQTDLALYRPGETVTASVRVVNFFGEPVQAIVRFEIFTREGISVLRSSPVDVSLPVGFEERVEINWQVPVNARDYYTITCQLTYEGLPGSSALEDYLTTGFCVEDRSLQTGGPKVSFENSFFTLDGQPAFLIGTNLTGAVFASAFEDPQVWERDFASMRANGLAVARILHISPFVTSQDGSRRAEPANLKLERLPRWLERRMDALVQISGRYGVALCLSLHDWMPVDLTDEELDAQKSFARLVAGRYRESPHVFFDIQNEPKVDFTNTQNTTRLWNQFLAEKYETAAALSASWGAYQAGQQWGSFTLEPGEAAWGNTRLADMGLFRSWLFNRWTAANLAGVREVSEAAVTVGFVQNMEHADQLLGADNIDFQSKHYYGDKGRFAAEMKIADRTFQGKGFGAGEFGSLVDHQARISGISRPTSDWDWYLEAVGSVLAMGGSHAWNWCWKEMPDNVFPWGINSPNDNLPRETLGVLRALALVSAGFQPTAAKPSVYLLATDTNRMGAGEVEVNQALLSSVRALLSLRVPFGVINESSLDELPEETSTLIMPLPYAMPDAVFQRLEAFVAAGGNLYVSGDITLDETRKRTRQDRLKTLFGVEFQQETGPPLLLRRGQDNHYLPAVQVAADGASLLEETGVWVNSHGQGKAFFNPFASEMTPGGLDELYSYVLEASRAAPYEDILPADFRLLVYRSPGAGDGDEIIYLHNQTSVTQEVTLKNRYRQQIPAQGKSILVFRGGELVSAALAGRLQDGDGTLVHIDAPAAVVSLDGSPLGDSAQLAVVPFGTGVIRVRLPDVSDPGVWVGRINEQKWQSLATRAPQQTSGMIILPAETSLRFQVLLFGNRDALEAAGKEVASRLLGRFALE